MKRLYLILLLPFLMGPASRDFIPFNDYMNYTAGAMVTNQNDSYSMGCWTQLDDLSSMISPICIAESAGNNHYIYTRIEATSGEVWTQGGTDFTQIAKITSPTITAGGWHYVGSTKTSTTEVRAHFNDTTATDSGTASSWVMDDVLIGRCRPNAALGEYDGRLAMCGMWDDDIADIGFDELSAGMWPSWVGSNMIGFWPIFGVDDPELDLAGTVKENMTLQSAPPADDRGPPVFLPIGGQ